jgi:hypothetical protein
VTAINPTADASLAARARDVRIDLTRGIANWFIFLDHIPHNAVNLLTLRNFGFSGAADLFVFVSGYAAALLYGKMARERGLVVTATRIFRRVWQLYAAYVVLFVIYIDVIGNVAAQTAATEIIHEYKVIGLVDQPTQTLMYGLMLQAKPLNLDTLQLFIALLAFFPLILWSMMRRPNWALAGSIVLYSAARQFGWGFAAFPSGNWYFNPYCWQLLFVLGAWFALSGAKFVRTVMHSRLFLAAASAYLLFALAVTVAGQFTDPGRILPAVLLDPFLPNDKDNLAVSRIVHFLALALVFTYLVPRDWSPLRWAVFQPVIKCGDEWLSAFCAGVFLSFAGHLVLITTPNSLVMQVLVSAAGVSIMTAIAYYISWSKRQDHRSSLAFTEPSRPR